MKAISPSGIAAAVVATVLNSQGALLVHESFSGYDTGVLKGQPVSDSATGLTGTWDGNTTANTLGTITTGLDFGSLQTSGGALRNTNNTVVVAAAISTTTAHTGTLWSSYLVSFAAAPSTSSNNGLEMRIGDSAAGADAPRYRTFADSRITGAGDVAVDYNSGSTTGLGGSGSTLLTGTTYILISSFTNLGGATGSAAQATTWALTAAQFDAMIASPLGAETYLTDAGSTLYTAKATETADTVKSTDTFGPGDFVQIVSVGDNDTVDEIRFGGTLGDVIPVIPEPGTAALALFGALAFLRRKR